MGKEDDEVALHLVVDIRDIFTRHGTHCHVCSNFDVNDRTMVKDINFSFRDFPVISLNIFLISDKAIAVVGSKKTLTTFKVRVEGFNFVRSICSGYRSILGCGLIYL